jgi:hypothetical protein
MSASPHADSDTRPEAVEESREKRPLRYVPCMGQPEGFKPGRWADPDSPFNRWAERHAVQFIVGGALLFGTLGVFVGFGFPSWPWAIGMGLLWAATGAMPGIGALRARRARQRRERRT